MGRSTKTYAPRSCSPGPRRAGGPTTAQPELGSRATSSAGNGALAGPAGADEDEDRATRTWAVQPRSLFEQRLALLGTETLQPPAVADADGLHEATGLDLAQTGQRFEDRDHLHLADGLVGVRLREELRQRREPILSLSFTSARSRRTLAAFSSAAGALLWCECGRLRHGRDHSASARAPFTTIFPLQPIASRRVHAQATGVRRSLSGSGPCRSRPRELLGRTLPGAHPAKRSADVGGTGSLGAQAGGENYPSELV